MITLGLGNRTNISAICAWLSPLPVDYFGRLRVDFSWNKENRRKFVFYGVQGEKGETKQSDFSFYGLGNGRELRHMLYCRSSVKSTYCGHDFKSIRRSEIFLNHLLKREREKGNSPGLSYFLLNISRTAGS